jgi:hypothetical protein
MGSLSLSALMSLTAATLPLRVPARFMPQLLVLGFGCSLLVTSLAANLPLVDLESRLAGFQTRQTDALSRQITNTFPGPTDPAPNNTYAWNRLNFALAALYLNTNLEAANQAVIEAGEVFLAADPTSYAGAEHGLHWHGNLWVRIHELFAADSRYFPGRLTPVAEQTIRALLWEWASRVGHAKTADLATWNSWKIWESENHSAMHDATAWGAATILRRFEPYRSLPYSDGSSAADNAVAWSNFLITYLRERGQRGMTVEYRSNTYSKYTLQGIYNFYDLAENPNLRYLAGAFLDLWWADAAQESIDGIAGGAGARMARPDDLRGERHAVPQMIWYYTGQGQTRNIHPGLMCLITSQYRLPLVVTDLALDVAGRGSFEAWSRRPGLNRPGYEAQFSSNRTYILDPDNGGILRYTYVTPDFVLGTHLFPKLPNERWSGISRQNRWHGAVLKGHPDALIVPQVVATTDNLRGQNEQWSIQHKGTLITQKCSTGVNLAGMRVYFPDEAILAREEANGWIFARNTHAYAAVRPARGGYQWVDGNWIQLADQYSPVIIEVVRAQDFVSFDEFRAAITAQPIVINASLGEDALFYQSLREGSAFTFFIEPTTTRPPLLNGQPIDIAPAFTYNSPFVSGAWPTVAVDFGADYTSSNINAALTPLVSSVDADFDGQTDDRLASIAFGTVFPPAGSANWSTPVNKSGPGIRHGVSVANIDSSAAPSIQLNRINAADIIQATNGAGSSKMRMASAHYWEKPSFLNGLNHAGALSFADRTDSVHAAFANAGAPTPPSGRASHVLVRNAGQWFVSVDHFPGTSGSLVFNGFQAHWLPFDPHANSLFRNTAVAGSPVAGSTLNDITALGVYSQHEQFNGSVANTVIHGLAALRVSLAPVSAAAQPSAEGVVTVRKGRFGKRLNFTAEFSDPVTAGAWITPPHLSASLFNHDPYGTRRATLRLQLSAPSPVDIPVYLRLTGSGLSVSGFSLASDPLIIPAGHALWDVDIVRRHPGSLALEDTVLEIQVDESDAYVWDPRQVLTLDLPALPFDQWRAVHFAPQELSNPSVSGPHAAPAGDGVPNILKYLAGLSPWQSFTGLPLDVVRSQDRFQLVVARNANAVDVMATPFHSTNLLDWQPLPVDRFTLSSIGFNAPTGMSWLTVDLPGNDPLATAFLRLQFSLPLVED